jgi:hypothetical protein
VIWLGILLLVLLACFSFVLIFGPPYLPTLQKQIETVLDMADLQSGQTLLELGCGDGKVLVAAARRGWSVVGYELNPILVIICKIRTWPYRKQVTLHWGNFLTQDWPKADAIFIFGLQRIMEKVDKKVMQSISDPVKLISFAFEIPGRKLVKQEDGLYLYRYERT